MDSIIDLLREDGIEPKYVASTNEGEYASPCPGCGGEDRFRSWPTQEKGGKWWCRQCDKSGDLIQYLREFRGMSFKESCSFLGIDNNASDFCKLGTTKESSKKWEPFETYPPGDPWQDKAIYLLERSEREIWKPGGKKIRCWLRRRGLRDGTIKNNRLGWNPEEVFSGRAKWGLLTRINENGRPTKVWIPSGSVIPTFKLGNIHKINIRRSDPSDFDLPPPNGGRYVLLPGSSAKTPLMLGKVKGFFIVVESDLDAMLIDQEAGDLISAISIGSATNKPDKETHRLIINSRLTLVSLDRDKAGVESAWNWWIKQYPNTKRWPSIEGKDPGEDYRAGGDIRKWVMAGITK